MEKRCFWCYTKRKTKVSGKKISELDRKDDERKLEENLKEQRINLLLKLEKTNRSHETLMRQKSRVN